MRDDHEKLMIMSSPKAGATLALRLVLGELGLTDEAKQWGGYPLKYVHGKHPPHGIAPSPAMQHRSRNASLSQCTQGSWICVAIVRNPMDRAISSYLHSMSNYDTIASHFRELVAACGTTSQVCQSNASFVEFSRALDRRAATRSKSKGDDHFMPQVVPSLPHGTASGVLYLPIEMFYHLDLSIDAACPPLARVNAINSKMEAAEAAAFGAADAMSHHYQKPKTSTNNVSRPDLWSWDRMRSELNAKTLPEYDTFWHDSDFCRHMVGDLYQADLHLYARMCGQKELRSSCKLFRDTCDDQLERLRDTCGLDLTPPPAA
jgi:hypothetical protein